MTVYCSMTFISFTMHLYPTILQKAPLRVSINAILNKIQDLDKLSRCITISKIFKHTCFVMFIFRRGIKLLNHGPGCFFLWEILTLV